MDIQSVYQILTPALAIGSITYFSKLFGKIIADQVPFTDNRKWHEELTGFIFILNLVPGIVGIAMGIYLPHFNNTISHIINFVILFILYIIYFYSNHFRSEIYYKVKLSEGISDYPKFADRIAEKIPLYITPILIFYVSTSEWLIGNLLSLTFVYSLVLGVLIQLSIQYSFRRLGNELVNVNIYFNNTNLEPIRNARIFKFNEDNVRIRVGNSIQILNKNEIFKIEMEIPKSKLLN